MWGGGGGHPLDLSPSNHRYPDTIAKLSLTSICDVGVKLGCLLLYRHNVEVWRVIYYQTNSMSTIPGRWFKGMLHSIEHWYLLVYPHTVEGHVLTY